MQYKFIRESGEGISKEYLNSIEKKYGFVFPKILSDYYLLHNKARINEREIKLDDDYIKVVRFIYPNEEDYSLEGLIEDNREYDDFPDNQIPFASDWGDDIFYWDKNNSNVSLLYPDSDEFMPVCDSIDLFFSMLNNENNIEESGSEKMENSNYLPLGSIVMLQNATQKLMIISRAISVNNNGKVFFFDYGGVPYPEGLMGDQMAYFNSDGIEKVIFEGYRDIDDEIMVDRINKYLEENPDTVRGSVDTWEV